jgi:hypothetical protein
MMIFFSFSSSKLPGYILPAIPALVVIIGMEIERVWRGERERLLEAAAWLTTALLLVIGVSFAIYLKREAISVAGFGWLLYWMPLVAAVIATALLAFRLRRRFMLAAVATVLAVVVGSAVLLLPVLSEKLSLKTLSLKAAAQLRPGERICFYIMKEFAPMFYAEGRVVCREGQSSALNALNIETLAQALERESSMIVFTTSNWAGELESESRFLAEPLESQGKALAVRVSLKR